jgi:hypothetical protein
MGNEEIKRELKIGILITPKEREELVTSRLYRYFLFGPTRICLA